MTTEFAPTRSGTCEACSAPDSWVTAVPGGEFTWLCDTCLWDAVCVSCGRPIGGEQDEADTFCRTEDECRVYSATSEARGEAIADSRQAEAEAKGAKGEVEWL